MSMKHKSEAEKYGGQFRIMRHCAAQSLVIHCKETANCSADVLLILSWHLGQARWRMVHSLFLIGLTES